jgi:hypothetical protein
MMRTDSPIDSIKPEGENAIATSLECITYIDMNVVRAGVVEHPRQWEFCG